MLSPSRCAVRGALALCAALVCVWGSLAAGTGPASPPAPESSASLISYAAPAGETYFALSLKAGKLPGAPAASAHDHMLVVDTSASQAGAHRKQSLAVLDAFLAGLNADDRVGMIAVDVQVERLTEGFLSPQSADFKAALRKLRQRIPLGSTSLLPGLEAALTSFQEDRPHSIVYIGDGMSTGNLIDATALRTLLGKMREQKVPVNSFAVGPRTDLQLLGILAEHTGGLVLVDELIDDAKLPAADVGKKLAAAANAPVFYPARIKLVPEVENLLPSAVPPLRTDRETIILGRGAVAASLKVVVEGTVKGAKETLQWTVKPKPAQAGNTFLAGLWADAERDQGLSVPVADGTLLNLARQTHEEQVMRMVVAGRQAIALRDVKQAEQIAWAIRQVDPANVEARTILAAVHKLKGLAPATPDFKPASATTSSKVTDSGKVRGGDPKQIASANALLQEASGTEASDDAEKPATTPAEMPAEKGDATPADEKPADEKMPDEKPADEATADEKTAAPAEKTDAAEPEAPAKDAADPADMPAKDGAEPAAAKAAVVDEAAPEDTPPLPAAGSKKQKLDDVDDRDGASGTAQRVDVLQREREMRRLRAEALRRDIRAMINAAEQLAASDAASAMSELKRSMNAVLSSTDIDADIREQLRTELQTVMNRVSARQGVNESRQIQKAEASAQKESQRRLVDELIQRNQKLEQMIDRVRSLLVEGYTGNENAFEEAEAVSRAAWELAPYSGTTLGAIFNSEAAGQLDKAMRMRSLRQDRMLETLYQVELSHVPFPDEPPLLYPPAEVWKSLTERRKKWASVDLVRYNPTEERIRKALDAPTEVQFIETPLKDALLFIKDQHNINIWLDEAKISDEGVATDQPITLQLSGVTLRSVLKLMLEPLQLTYLIDDEVMKITTVVAAGEKLSTRVYPVGDLVIPIRQGQAGGLGQGLGGVGGIGGAGGGMGGGQFGVGGGGQNGNGFGGGGGRGAAGGGMFSVPPE